MICRRPFDYLILGRWAAPCCGDWLDRDAGVAPPPADPWELWNHPRLVALRERVLAGDYQAHCSRCPLGAQRTGFAAPTPDCLPVMERPPAVLELAQDRTCNLHCPSCRAAREVHSARPEDERVLRAWLAAGRGTVFSVSHLGDPFASPLYRPLLFAARPPEGARLHLFTNGLLLPGCWPRMSGWRGRVTGVRQSIDAATAATYELLRRGGTWEKLEHCQRFISALRRGGEIGHWHWAFVVQADNWREMPAFVYRAEEYGADAVYFSGIRRWNLSAEEYARKNVFDPAHPEHADFIASLDDPALKRPVVAEGIFRPAVHGLLAPKLAVITD